MRRRSLSRRDIAFSKALQAHGWCVFAIDPQTRRPWTGAEAVQAGSTMLGIESVNTDGTPPTPCPHCDTPMPYFILDLDASDVILPGGWCPHCDERVKLAAISWEAA